MPGMFGGGLFGGGNTNARRATGIGGMMQGNIPGMDGYVQGVDPAISAAKNIWGDPAVTAAHNIMGTGTQPGGEGPLGFLTSSPYNGHVDRVSGRPGYKTRHMRSGASSHHDNGGSNYDRMRAKAAAEAAEQKK